MRRFVRFGANQELLSYAEGFHCFLPGPATLVALHTTERLFGVPSKHDLAKLANDTFAITRDCRHAGEEHRCWWALTLSSFKFLEMSQLQPAQWRAYFPHGLYAETLLKIGSRERYGIVVAGERYAGVSSYDACLSSFPEVFGPTGIFWKNLEHNLKANLTYLADVPSRREAEARLHAFMEFAQSRAGVAGMRFHDFIASLLHYIGGPPAPNVHFTDTVELFLPDNEILGAGRFRLLELFLARYAELAAIYNSVVAADHHGHPVDTAKGEFPFFVHLPSGSEDCWRRKTLFVNDAGIMLDDQVMATTPVRGVPDLIRVMAQALGHRRFAIIPKAVPFLAQMKHLAAFVNPDDCHYENQVNEFIRRLWQAGIEFPVVTGRWLQILNALQALGDQALLLPPDMHLAFKAERLTGAELHAILHQEDPRQLWRTITSLLAECALAEQAGEIESMLAKLAAAGYLPADYPLVHARTQQQLQQIRSRAARSAPSLNAEIERKGEAWLDIFQRLLALAREHGFLAKLLREMLLPPTKGQKLVREHPACKAQFEAKLDQALALKQKNRSSPEIDRLLEEIVTGLLAQRLISPHMLLEHCRTFLADGFLKSLGGVVPAALIALHYELEHLCAWMDFEVEHQRKEYMESKEAAEKVLATLVARAQLVRVALLKALDALRMVDYYIGPLLVWILGGTPLLDKIKQQLHVIPHPLTPFKITAD